MQDDATNQGAALSDANGDEGHGLLDLMILIAEHLRLLVLVPLLVGVVALGITFLVPPTFTARTLFLPPQQQQNSATAALASLGALSSLAGAAVNLKSPVDQFAAMLQSTTIADRLIDRFSLVKVYDVRYREEARRDLTKNVRVSVGRKDGLITVEVEDEDPKRAADMANQHVEELRRLVSGLALTEAQQRRVFFEAQLAKTRDSLTRAQQALQSSGFNPGAMQAEPKATAERFALLQAQATAAEVRLQTLRRGLADTAPEVQWQATQLAALREQLGKLEKAEPSDGGPDYVSKYREFKYEEALFDVFSRQYEMARLDESKEGGLIQVIDYATPPERKTRPHRGLIAVVTVLVSFIVLIVYLLTRNMWRAAARSPATASKLARLRASLGRR